MQKSPKGSRIITFDTGDKTKHNGKMSNPIIKQLESQSHLTHHSQHTVPDTPMQVTEGSYLGTVKMRVSLSIAVSQR